MAMQKPCSYAETARAYVLPNLFMGLHVATALFPLLKPWDMCKLP